MNPRLNSPLMLLALIAAALLMAACPATRKAPSDTGAQKIQGDKPITGESSFDADGFREKLQGHWRVRRGERVLFEFSFAGDQATVVDRRFTTTREITGPLKLRSATGFGITDADGATYYYSAVFDGEDVFMGLGAAIESEAGETFTARIGAWERLVRKKDEEGCTYIKTWGGSTSEETVACELKQKGERTVFSYQSEDPFRPGKLKTYELTVVGDYLLGKELADSRAEAFDPKAEPKAASEKPKPAPAKELLVALPDTPDESKAAAPKKGESQPTAATPPATAPKPGTVVTAPSAPAQGAVNAPVEPPPAKKTVEDAPKAP